MTKQVQRRRGTAAQHTSFTGAEGEISVNTTNKSVHVHDGTTAGGIEAARADLGNVSDANLNAALSGNTLASLTITSADINGGTIDGTVIGGSTPAAISGATGSFSGNLTVDTDTLFVDAANNRVGVGTASPTRVLHLSASGTESAIRLDNTVSGRPFIVTYDDSQNLEFTNSSDAGYIAFRNGTGAGSERLRITSTGNVGIGTTSNRNSTKLDVLGDVTFGANASYYGTLAYNAGAGFLDMTSSDGGFRWFAQSGPTERMRITSSGGIEIPNQNAIDELTFTGTDFTNVFSATTSGFQLGTTGAGYLAFLTDNTERMRITSTGDVGIGLTNPGVPLHVKGQTNGNVMIVDATGTAANYIFDVRDDGTSVFRVDPSGRVGIGTSSPVYSFVVSAAGASGIEFGPAFSGTANLVQHYSRSGGVYVDAVNVAAQHRFDISGAERARIDASGNLGLGTSSPAAFSGYTTLGINNATNGGILDLMQGGSMRMRLIGLAGSAVIETPASLPIVFSPAGTEKMRIDAWVTWGLGRTVLLIAVQAQLRSM
jgi:hypothetical protein